MKKAVMCIAQTFAKAESIVSKLKAVSFSDNDISVVFPNKKSTKNFANNHSTRSPVAAGDVAGAGSVLGGSVGLIAGIAALAIPGLGPFVAAGPLLGALSGAAAGAAVGGIAGGLMGMGISETEAKHYEKKLTEGNILISVHAESTDQRQVARDLFEEAHAEDICLSADGKTLRENTASSTA
jgi:uncharacterized membrane protein